MSAVYQYICELSTQNKTRNLSLKMSLIANTVGLYNQSQKRTSKKPHSPVVRKQACYVQS